MPSSRTGTFASRRSALRLIREASENSTSARVASASARTVEPELERSTSPRTFGPTSTPMTTKRIAGVRGVPAIRPDTDATAKTASAMIASDQSIQGLPRSEWSSRIELSVRRTEE